MAVCGRSRTIAGVAEILVSVAVGDGRRGVVTRGRWGELTVGLEDEPGLGTVVAGDGPAAMVVRAEDRDVWVLGGRLPRRATSVWARDVHGTLVEGICEAGAWLAAVVQPLGGSEEPPVLFRDGAGDLVPRKVRVRHRPVTDTTVPCPACDRVAWVRRSTLPFPRTGAELICRACGHRESGGFFYAAGDEPDRSEGAMTAVEAAWLDERRLDVLRRLSFPVFELDERWAGERTLGGWAGRSTDDVGDVRLHHAGTAGRWVEVGSSLPGSGDPEPEAALRSALMNADESPWPDASEAAVALWHRARDRAVLAQVAAATPGTVAFPVDLRPREFRILTVPGAWAATARMEGIDVTVSGVGADPAGIGLRRVHDPPSLLRRNF